MRRRPSVTASTTSSPEGLTARLERALAERGIRAADLRYAIGVGVLVGLSPLSGSARAVPKVVIGAVAGAATLALRRRYPEPAASRSQALAKPSAAVWGILVAAVVAFSPTLAWLYREYTTSIWNNADGLFVAAAMALLARSALQRDRGGAPEASAWGFALLVPALALVALDAGLRSRTLSAMGLVLALPGLSLLLLGARRTRLLALPLALGIFLVPIPMGLEDPLGLASAGAALADPIVRSLGVEAYRHQIAFRLSSGWLGVGGNCSGVSALHAAAALSVLLACTARTRARRLLPLVLLVPIALFANTLRVAGLVLVADRFGVGVLHLPLHGLSGIATVWLVVGAAWLLADRPALREALA